MLIAYTITYMELTYWERNSLLNQEPWKKLQQKKKAESLKKLNQHKKKCFHP